MFLRAAAVFFALCAAALPAQQIAVSNPHGTANDAAAGGLIFRAHCAVCHGADGKGARGPDLTRGFFRHANTDEDLYKLIADGIPGTEMPGIFFNGTQLWQIVAHVRSLSARRASVKLTGNPANGSELFSGKAGCAMCHMVNGQGGRMGPDLSLIGDLRSPEHLRTAILKPNAEVFPDMRSIRAVTRDGKTITGRRMNEDTVSVQVLDSNEKLVSLMKADMTTYEVIKESAMPSYEGKLSSSEVDDVVAYLAGLQRKRNP